MARFTPLVRRLFTLLISCLEVRVAERAPYVPDSLHPPCPSHGAPWVRSGSRHPNRNVRCSSLRSSKTLIITWMQTISPTVFYSLPLKQSQPYGAIRFWTSWKFWLTSWTKNKDHRRTREPRGPASRTASTLPHDRHRIWVFNFHSHYYPG